MKQIKKHRKDILIILLFSIIYLMIAAILTHGQFYFASTTDFEMQHYLFPEYFRNLFYETKDLFPDFALNIGGGQNIYNLSYYGLLNPFILISYLLPMIPMFNYLIILSFIIVVSSTFLFYKFLASHKLKPTTCLIVSLLFLFATPLIYHAKRHIMFINYFPFLILALFGVDRFISQKKPILLITATCMMIFTSFYYSVAGIIVLIIYAIYQFFQKEKGFKNLVKFLLKLSVPFMIAVLISAILWLPTFYTLVTGRGESIKNLELVKLLVPNFKFLYSSYSLGLTFLEFILIGVLIFDKNIKKSTRLLALTLSIIFMFPIFNYILNGTLYVNAKSLIPFLPLALLLVGISLEHLLKHRKKIEGYLLISTCIICIIGNFNDKLIPRNNIKSKLQKDYQTLVDYIIKKDSSFYRIGDQTAVPEALNKIHNMKEYKSSIYSSTQNNNYQKWIKNIQKNNQAYRNNMMTTLSGNILSEGMMGEKYVISIKKLEGGYKLIKKQNNLRLYENEFALPIIYATENELTKKSYKTLMYPMTVISSFANGNQEDETELKPIDFEAIDSKNITIEKSESIKLKAKEDNYIILDSKTDLKDKVVFITFKNNFNKRCNGRKEDQVININNISNKLTCKGWKYHNKNKIFHYVIVSPDNLKVTLSKGAYDLEDITAYAIPKSKLLDEKRKVTPLKLNTKKTKGDKIVGTMNLSKDENMVLALPYDKGFKIKVDGEEVTYQESIQNGITFPLKKGNHNIEIIYEAPYKNLGSLLSLIGIMIFIIYSLYMKKQKATKINRKATKNWWKN